MSAAEKGATGGGDNPPNPPSAPGSTAPSQRVRPSPKYEVKGASCGVACLKYLLFIVNVIVWSPTGFCGLAGLNLSPVRRAP
ncbi:unnamed protein product [Ixodes pacificus]